MAFDLSGTRLQNSPYFCIFKCTRAVKQKAWNEAENRERDWGETPHKCVRLTRFARVKLLCHALPISLLILRKKLDVLQSTIVPLTNSPCINKRKGENGGGGWRGSEFPLNPPQGTPSDCIPYMGDGNVTESSFSIA